MSYMDGPSRTVTPLVIVAVAHTTLRLLIVDLLERDEVEWKLRATASQTDLDTALQEEEPDLLILDAADFSAFCRKDSLQTFPPGRIVVIGPEPDAAYEFAVRHDGAGAWIARDRVGEELSQCMNNVLDFTHWPASTA